jgi:ferredoxin
MIRSHMFDAFLRQHDEAAWARAVQSLLPEIHEVDRNATRIWFHFFPLALAEAIADIPDRLELERTLRLDGAYRLADQIDTSHWFLYGHRHWPQVKAAILKRSASGTAPASLELPALIRETAALAGPEAPVLLGITAVGLMTLQQVGLSAFQDSSGSIRPPADLLSKTPAQIVEARQRNDSQGIAGLWRGIRTQFSVRYDEGRRDARFRVINQQHITTASAEAAAPASAGPRPCLAGPIPVECRTASCGTCWVGVFAGAERLTDVEPMEARRMKEFGYINTSEPKPIIRLACSAMALGNISLVIPPWNGFLGVRRGFREPFTSQQRR